MSICHLALLKIPEDFATPSSQPVQSCLDGRRQRHREKEDVSSCSQGFGFTKYGEKPIPNH